MHICILELTGFASLVYEHHVLGGARVEQTQFIVRVSHCAGDGLFAAVTCCSVVLQLAALDAINQEH